MHIVVYLVVLEMFLKQFSSFQFVCRLYLYKIGFNYILYRLVGKLLNFIKRNIFFKTYNFIKN